MIESIRNRTLRRLVIIAFVPVSIPLYAILGVGWGLYEAGKAVYALPSDIRSVW